MAFDFQNGGGGGRPPDADDIAAVAFFLNAAEQSGEMFGSHTAHDAFDAFARVLGLPVEEFRSACSNPPQDD